MDETKRSTAINEITGMAVDLTTLVCALMQTNPPR